MLEEVRRRIEELAEAGRDSRAARARHARGGNSLWRWAHKVRKTLLTPWGSIHGLRLPRLREVEEKKEVPFLSSKRHDTGLAEMLLASTLGGMSYRKVVNWARRHLDMAISPAWVGGGGGQAGRSASLRALLGAAV